MNRADLMKLMDLDAAATPRPWAWDEVHPGQPWSDVRALTGAGDSAPVVLEGSFDHNRQESSLCINPADQAYLLAACNALPELLADNERLRALLAQVQAALARLVPVDEDQLDPLDEDELAQLRSTLATALVDCGERLAGRVPDPEAGNV